MIPWLAGKASQTIPTWQSEAYQYQKQFLFLLLRHRHHLRRLQSLGGVRAAAAAGLEHSLATNAMSGVKSDNDAWRRQPGHPLMQTNPQLSMCQDSIWPTLQKRICRAFVNGCFAPWTPAV